MTRGLRLRHREAHVGEEPAGTPVPDVLLGLVVGRRPGSADHVEPELLPQLLQLCSCHGLIVT